LLQLNQGVVRPTINLPRQAAGRISKSQKSIEHK
jgi:hypothetical protein